MPKLLYVSTVVSSGEFKIIRYEKKIKLKNIFRNEKSILRAIFRMSFLTGENPIWILTDHRPGEHNLEYCLFS